MIRRPAMMAGLTFERRGDPEEGLDDVLRDAASGNPTVLPLLNSRSTSCGGAAPVRACCGSPTTRILAACTARCGCGRTRSLPASRRAVRASLPKVLAALVHTDPTDDRRILQNRISRDQFSNSPDCRR